MTIKLNQILYQRSKDWLDKRPNTGILKFLDGRTQKKEDKESLIAGHRWVQVGYRYILGTILFWVQNGYKSFWVQFYNGYKLGTISICTQGFPPITF